MFSRIRRRWVSARASLMFYRGRPDEAIEMCDRLLRRHPDEPLLYQLLGRAHFGQKSYLRAYWSLSQAVQRGRAGRALPASADYWLGLSAFHLGLHEACLEALERFCERQGLLARHFTPSVSRVRAVTTRGYAHLKRGELTQAAERFEEVLGSGNFEDTGVALDLATLYCSEEVGRYREAVGILEEAVVRFPQEVELLKALSYAHSLMDEHSRALFYARKCLEQNPEDRWAHQQMAYLHAQGDVMDRVAARSELDRLLQADPQDPWAQEFQRYLKARGGRPPVKAAYLRLVERLD